MTDRRLFIQSFLSVLTAFFLPSTSQASPAKQTPLGNPPANFTIIGVGGAGGKTVRHMCDCDVQGIKLICADSDASRLHDNGAHKTILLGGGIYIPRPAKSRMAARYAEAEIRYAIEGTDMLFVTTNLGCGTGSGAAPAIARIAKNMGIMTMGVVTMPLPCEYVRRNKFAMPALSELEASVDSLIILDPEKLEEKYFSNSTEEDIVSHGNDLIRNAINDIVQVVNSPSSVSIGFVDLLDSISAPGKTSIGTAVARGTDRARLAAEQALACPFFSRTHLSEAKGALVMIASSKGSLRFSEIKLAMNAIRANISINTQVLFGTLDDESLGDNLKVTIMATGLN
jgi:cell division protein FtsZ